MEGDLVQAEAFKQAVPGPHQDSRDNISVKEVYRQIRKEAALKASDKKYGRPSAKLKGPLRLNLFCGLSDMIRLSTSKLIFSRCYWQPTV